MKNLLILLIPCLMWVSCEDKAILKVQNKVHNSRLENINLGDISIYATLLPSQTSPDKEVKDRRDNFPKASQLEFYMENNGRKVYLKTKSVYVLEAGANLLITITDSTAVINPLLQ